MEVAIGRLSVDDADYSSNCSCLFHPAFLQYIPPHPQIMHHHHLPCRIVDVTVSWVDGVSAPPVWRPASVTVNSTAILGPHDDDTALPDPTAAAAFATAHTPAPAPSDLGPPSPPGKSYLRGRGGKAEAPRSLTCPAPGCNREAFSTMRELVEHQIKIHFPDRTWAQVPAAAAAAAKGRSLSSLAAIASACTRRPKTAPCARGAASSKSSRRSWLGKRFVLNLHPIS